MEKDEDFLEVLGFEDDSNNSQEISNQNVTNEVKDENIISIDRLFEQHELDTEEEKKQRELEKAKEMIEDKRIERVQVGLLLFLLVAGSLIYFFGYDLFEPFIKIN